MKNFGRATAQNSCKLQQLLPVTPIRRLSY